MNMITSQAQVFPSIYIRKTVDLTLTLPAGEKGVCGAIGKLSIGNPYYPRILNSATEPLKSTNVNNGGSLDNELAYHIADFFSGFNGKMIIGRVMGADSTTKLIQLVKPASEIEILDTTDVNIFGANNIIDWQDTLATELLEMIVTACPSDKTTVQIVNVSDLITVSIFDEFGKEIYKVSGGASFDSVDDSNVNNYIGNVADPKIISIKVDTDHADYTSDFSVTKTYDNGLIEDTGAVGYESATDILRGQIEKCDYAITGGLTDVTAIQALRAVTFEAKVLLVIDIKGTTIATANAFRLSLNMNEEDVYFLWNRIKNKFTTGNLNIGLAGWFVGQCVKRNLSVLVADVEYRVSGIAGVDYEVPRLPAEALVTLTNDEKTSLTNYRINTVSELNDKLIIGDVLSGNPKNVSLRLFPVSEANHFINRYIARILLIKLFKNRGLARNFIDKEVGKLFERCERNSYFNTSIEGLPYEYTVTLKDIDTILVEYKYVPEGVMRKGEVAGTLTQKIGE